MPEHKLARFRKLLVARAKLRMEGLKLFEPMPVQTAFLSSSCRERIVYGSNRSGKTTVAMVDLARILTGQDPLGRLPRENLIWYVVGKDGRELANVVHKKLFMPACFQIIRDERTRQWRAFRPYQEADAQREQEARWAPPLIPERFVREVSWENKKEGLPKLVKLINGSEIHFFSGNARPPHGSSIHGANFDEEVPDGWYAEIAARLVDYRGYFTWSATPEQGTDQLLILHERAMGEMERFMQTGVKPSIEEYFMAIHGNRHLTREQVEEFESKLTDEQKRVKVYGEFLQLGASVFPEFLPSLHVVDQFPIPLDWTRYLYIDPGYQVCAVLFMAVPDPRDEKHAGYRYVYDELYLYNCNADLFGRKMREKCEGQDFEAFLIDEHEARKHSAGDGKTLASQYSEALSRYKIRSRTTGYGFSPGSDDPKADVAAIRDWLRNRPDKGPILRVFPKDAIPNFHYEITHWRFKKDAKGLVTDEPESRGRVHLMAGLRGLVQCDPQWVRPKHMPAPDEIQRIIAEDRRREKALYGDGPAVFCGPRGARVGVGA